MYVFGTEVTPPNAEQRLLLYRISLVEEPLTDPEFINSTMPMSIEETAVYPDLVIFLYETGLNGAYYQLRVHRSYDLDSGILTQVKYDLHVSSDYAGENILKNVSIVWESADGGLVITKFNKCITDDGGILMGHILVGDDGNIFPVEWSSLAVTTQLREILTELQELRALMLYFS